MESEPTDTGKGRLRASMLGGAKVDLINMTWPFARMNLYEDALEILPTIAGFRPMVVPRTDIEGLHLLKAYPGLRVQVHLTNGRIGRVEFLGSRRRTVEEIHHAGWNALITKSFRR